MGMGWRIGRPTGSLNGEVSREVRQLLARNPTARRARYPIGHRVLRKLIAPATFGLMMMCYLILDLAMIDVEGAFSILAPSYPVMRAEASTEVTEIIRTVPSYVLGAQIGLLGVISLGLALVTLIAQRDDATTDVKVYYHESMFLGTAASGIALAAAVTMQFLWPMQTVYHWLGGGSDAPAFKTALVVVHVGWLILNLWAVAHFVSVTFLFVQQASRERLRERYTANVVLPRELTQRLREQMYGSMGMTDDRPAPNAIFGFSFGTPSEIEIKREFGSDTGLVDVRVAVVRWVLRQWSARCAADTSSRSGNIGPRLWFTPALDRPMTGHQAWCRRSGGVPLTSFERLALRYAFKFRRIRHDA